MSGPQATKTYSLLAIGGASIAVALISSRIDGSMFYILSSGSMILAILIASAALDATFKGLAWLRERQEKHLLTSSAISYSSLHAPTASAPLQKSPS